MLEQGETLKILRKNSLKLISKSWTWRL